MCTRIFYIVELVRDWCTRSRAARFRRELSVDGELERVKIGSTWRIGGITIRGSESYRIPKIVSNEHPDSKIVKLSREETVLLFLPIYLPIFHLSLPISLVKCVSRVPRFLFSFFSFGREKWSRWIDYRKDCFRLRFTAWFRIQMVFCRGLKHIWLFENLKLLSSFLN